MCLFFLCEFSLGEPCFLVHLHLSPDLTRVHAEENTDFVSTSFFYMKDVIKGTTIEYNVSAHVEDSSHAGCLI